MTSETKIYFDPHDCRHGTLCMVKFYGLLYRFWESWSFPFLCTCPNLYLYFPVIKVHIASQVWQSVSTNHGEYVVKVCFFYSKAKKVNKYIFENLYIGESVVACLVWFYVNTFLISYIHFSLQLQTYRVFFVCIKTFIQYYLINLYQLGTSIMPRQLHMSMKPCTILSL
jgi:hypothetical protein